MFFLIETRSNQIFRNPLGLGPSSSRVRVAGWTVFARCGVHGLCHRDAAHGVFGGSAWNPAGTGHLVACLRKKFHQDLVEWLDGAGCVGVIATVLGRLGSVLERFTFPGSPETVWTVIVASRLLLGLGARD